VQLGLMANFFIFGGLLGVIFSALFEMLTELSFSAVFPTCSMIFLDKRDIITDRTRSTVLKPVTEDCTAVSAMMWILVPGLIEETGKAMWLFWRFRRSESDMPERCCFGLCGASGSSSCAGGWYKLASTPYHILLCALSSGAGFECVENMKYVFFNSVPTAQDASPGGTLVQIAVARCITSGLHIAWSGLIGFGLAKRLFYPERARPGLLTVICPAMVLHGLFDWSLAAVSAIGKRQHSPAGMDKDDANLACVLLMVLCTCIVVGSYLWLGCLTGCRCCRSLCCAPDFWPAADSWVDARERVGMGSNVVANQEPLLVGPAASCRTLL